jgi:UDP-perosamine 4-acetyltransferase
VIVGGGGHAKVIIEIFQAFTDAFEVIGAVDPDPAAGGFGGAPRLGGDDCLPDLRARGVTCAFPALGDNDRRARVAALLEDLGFDIPAALSRQAFVSPSAALGRGVAVMAGAVINADTQVGDFAIVNSGAIVEHDCRVGAGAHLGPKSALGGGVIVGARTFIGLGANILPGLTIGADVVVGAGACVTKSLVDGVVAVGVPARVILQSQTR